MIANRRVNNGQRKNLLVIILVIAFAFLQANCTNVISYADPVDAEHLINSQENVLAMMHESWCDSCNDFDSNFNILADELKKKHPALSFAKIDLANNQDAWRLYGAKGLPHFVLTSRGTPISYDGPLDAEKLGHWVMNSLDRKPVQLKKSRNELIKSTLRWV